MQAHSPHSCLNLIRGIFAAFSLGAAGFSLGGCDWGPKIQVVAETDEKQFHDAQQLLREDRTKEALAAFNRVIRKRPDDAPESHLEAGQLYLKVEKNPVLAIYHFEEYLAEKPKSDQAPMVRQLIDTAKKDFAHSLPGQPNIGDFDRLDLLEQIKTLRAENEDLHHQLAQMPAHSNVIALENVTPVPLANRPTASVPPAGSRGQTPSSTPASATSAAAAGGKSYTVKSGDSLFIIAKQNGTTVAALKAANNMKTDSLKPGQVLKIP